MPLQNFDYTNAREFEGKMNTMLTMMHSAGETLNMGTFVNWLLYKKRLTERDKIQCAISGVLHLADLNKLPK